MEYLRLHTGEQVPKIGFGTYLITPGDEAYKAVSTALEVGYRWIDTASFYENEASVGKAIRESGLSREEVCVTSKLWNDSQGYEHTMEAGKRSCDALGLEYIDVFMVHWPGQDTTRLLRTWEAMENLKEEKIIRSVAASNFLREHIELFKTQDLPMPSMNQIEMHPKMNCEKEREYFQSQGIAVQAWRPLLNGNMHELSSLEPVAQKYGKTCAQVVLRWLTQKDVIVIPKTVRKERMRENFSIFDFSLTKEESLQVDALNENKRLGPDPKIFFGTERMNIA